MRKEDTDTTVHLIGVVHLTGPADAQRSKETDSKPEVKQTSMPTVHLALENVIRMGDRSRTLPMLQPIGLAHDSRPTKRSGSVAAVPNVALCESHASFDLDTPTISIFREARIWRIDADHIGI